MKIIVASNNAGKIEELHALFAGTGFVPIPQAAFKVTEIEEAGLTFVENALLKARHACRETGLPALADDSGLVVPILQGAPGIYSARYAGPTATPEENIQKLLAALLEVPESKRIASFHCSLVFMAHEKDPAPLICQGEWRGSILLAPRGQDGFGYDPVFGVAANQSAAELPLAVKNKQSHRGKALRLLLSQLREQIGSERT